MKIIGVFICAATLFGFEVFGQDQKPVKTAFETAGVGSAVAYQTALARADVAVAKSLVNDNVLGGSFNQINASVAFVARAAVPQETALFHIKNATELFQQMDSLPGSYGHAQMQGGFSSLGDGSRKGNPIFKKLLYNLIRAKQLGIPSDRVVGAVLSSSESRIPRQLMRYRMTSLLNDLKAAEKLGLDTPNNLTLLEDGRAPIVTKGNPKYLGQKAEVDHRVARSIAPQFENEIANLQLLPEEINGIKLASHGPLEQEHLLRLQSAYGRPIFINRMVTAGGTAVLVAVPFELAFQIFGNGPIDYPRVAGVGLLAGGTATIGDALGNATTFALMRTEAGYSASSAVAELVGLRSASHFANGAGGLVGGGATAILFAYGGYGLGYYDLQTANRSAVAGVADPSG